MTKLDQAWTAWQALSRTDRARFLACLRDAYAREREAAVWERSSARGVRVSRFSDFLSLTEADFQAAAAAQQMPIPAGRQRVERRAKRASRPACRWQTGLVPTHERERGVR